MYRIEEYFNEQWTVIGSRIPTWEEAQIIAHHERDDAPVRVKKEGSGPFTLKDYAGDDAALLKATWICAGKPGYSSEDGR